MMNNEIYKKKYNPYLPNIRYGAQYGNSFNIFSIKIAYISKSIVQ